MGSTPPDQTAIIPPKLIKISEIERKSQYINSWKQNPSQLFCFCLATITFLCFYFYGTDEGQVKSEYIIPSI